MNTLQGNIGNNNFYNFGNSRYLNASKEFLNSNTLIAKLGFLILVIFIFIILLRLGIILLSYIYSDRRDPIIIDGMIMGDNFIIKEQNPNKKNSIPILRSNNEKEGLEFTWSVWLYIETPSNTTTNNKYKHIFNKGDGTRPLDGDDIFVPNNAPGLYLKEDHTKLKIIINSVKSPLINESYLDIGNIPIKKWFNVIIRCEQKVVDIFINGSLTKSKILDDIPRQNYDNIYIARNNGFSGKLSLLRYYSRSININEIDNIITSGPKLKFLNSTSENSKPYYLSYRWFNNIDDLE